MSYHRYPPEPPRHRSVYWLILLMAAVLLANLVHQSGLA